nr:hypothetical protein [Tanacetum cinerariifolium]GEW44718.1 hypothetical protein [Tanacetum cinerariifolium]
MLNLLKTNADLFTYDTPLGRIFDEFSRLSGMDDDLFAYKVEIPKPSRAQSVEQQYDALKNNDLENFEPRKCDDEEVLTNEELFDIEEENLDEENKIAEIFRIETDIFHFETPLCKAFKDFDYLLQIDVDVLTNNLSGFKTYDEYKNACIYEWNKDVSWVADRPWLDYGPWMELCDDIEHVFKLSF